MSAFYDNFVRLCAEHHVSESGAAKSIGLSNAAASGWGKGKIPSNTTRIKLAELFGVTVDDLMGEPAKKEPPAETGEQFSPLDSRWFSLTEEEKLQAWEFIVQLRAKHRAEQEEDQ